MTEREKMIEILKQTSDLWKEEESHGYIVSVDLGKIADTLTEAGIGDVSEWKHEAEIADRALTNTCAILYAQGVEYPYSDEEWQLQQAEKELQEGKKDE